MESTRPPAQGSLADSEAGGTPANGRSLVWQRRQLLLGMSGPAPAFFNRRLELRYRGQAPASNHGYLGSTLLQVAHRAALLLVTHFLEARRGPCTTVCASST